MQYTVDWKLYAHDDIMIWLWNRCYMESTVRGPAERDTVQQRPTMNGALNCEIIITLSNGLSQQQATAALRDWLWSIHRPFRSNATIRNYFFLLLSWFVFFLHLSRFPLCVQTTHTLLYVARYGRDPTSSIDNIMRMYKTDNKKIHIYTFM